jgi:hypothetical protein
MAPQCKAAAITQAIYLGVTQPAPLPYTVLVDENEWSHAETS